MATGAEYVVTDLVDGVVKALQGFGDPSPGYVVGQVDGGLQAQADIEQAIDDPVEQFLAAVYLLRSDSSPGEVP